MPVFDDDLRSKDVTGKSWAVYESMDAGEELRLGLTVEAGENISFSVNMAGSQTFEEYVDYVNVTLTGHEALSIECDPEFDGWRVLRSTRMLSGNHPDETKIIPTTTVGEKLHFEPFGVGYYRKLAACQGNVTVSDQFNLTIVALRDIKLNVGVGMAESFSVLEILTMSLWILYSWWWDYYVIEWWVITVLFTFSAIAWYRDLLRTSFIARVEKYGLLKIPANFFRVEFESAIVSTFLTFNAVHFLLRLVIINLNPYAKNLDAMVLIPILVHISLPLGVAWAWRSVEHSIYAWGLLFIYSSALLWQGFFVLPVYSFIKFTLALIRLR